MPHPLAPTTIEASGLNETLVAQLVLKQLNVTAQCSGVELSRRTGLEFTVLEPVLETLRHASLCEIVGGGLLAGVSYEYRITDAGRRRAVLCLEQSQYVGIAPVPLAQYTQYMAALARATQRKITRDRVHRALSHLVLSNGVIDQIGLAATAGHSMFVYGPPGNGKTVIASAVHTLLDDEMAIPYALEVEGQIVKLFNPINHDPLPAPDEDYAAGGRTDKRWVRCRRPKVMVGGELTMRSLDLAYSETSGFYSAPVHLTANGGVLVIDDFGRQQCSPRDLLNRWIVPLETRCDFLTLETGQSFEIPFMVMLVFATNMKPAELVDEALLRRIQYKVLAESPTSDDFKRIFAACCRARGLERGEELVDSLIASYILPRGIQLRGCQPRDLIDHALARAAYLNYPRELTLELLEAACGGYFLEGGAAASGV
jgi:predicted ATPase with chaperone activity